MLLASHIPSGKVVALNAYHKAVLSDTCQQHVPQREKELLESLSHPFISHTIGSLSDTNSLYLIFEVEPGATLSSLLYNSCDYGITDTQKVFYAACVVSVLKYAHSRNIIHRGIHPDSLLIDKRGYLKVSDWGFAKEVVDRTFTLCGHVEYLCPEAISHDAGYGKGADWWALGVLIFEMLMGRSAFVPVTEDMWGGQCSPGDQQCHDTTTIENIVGADPAFPPHMPHPAKSIIQGLCQKNPTQRLGCRKGGRGVEDVEKHMWFQQGRGMDWSRLEKFLITPPWVPVVKGPLDCRYYDATLVSAPITEAPVYTGYNCVEWNDFRPSLPLTHSGVESPSAHSSASTAEPSDEDDSSGSATDRVDVVVVNCRT